MKKLFSLVLFLLFCFSAFAWESSYSEKDGLTKKELVKIFSEELKKPQYAHQIIRYEVYKTQEKQNYYWEVRTTDETYSAAYGKCITLYIGNGYISYYSFGGSTLMGNGLYKSKNINEKKDCLSLEADWRETLEHLIKESVFYLDKYKKMSEDKYRSLMYLSNMYFSFDLIDIDNLVFKELYYYHTNAKDLPSYIVANFPKTECLYSMSEYIKEVDLKDDLILKYAIKYNNEILYKAKTPYFIYTKKEVKNLIKKEKSDIINYRLCYYSYYYYDNKNDKYYTLIIEEADYFNKKDLKKNNYDVFGNNKVSKFRYVK